MEMLFQSSVGCVVGAIGSSVLCMSVPYSPESLPLKLAAFAMFGSFMGASLTPLLLMAGRFLRPLSHVQSPL